MVMEVTVTERVRVLHEEKAGLIRQMQALNDKPAAEKRSMVAEEQTQWDGMFARCGTIDEAIKREEFLLAEEKRNAALSEGTGTLAGQGNSRTGDGPDGGNQRAFQAAVDTRQLLNDMGWLTERGGIDEPVGIPMEERAQVYMQTMMSENPAFHGLNVKAVRSLLQRQDDAMKVNMLGGWNNMEAGAQRYFQAIYGGQEAELRALQVDSATAGGYIVPSQRFIARLIKNVDDIVFMRQVGTVLPPVMNAQSIGVPTLENDPADADWTVELDIGTEDSSLDFGFREMVPHPLGKLIKVSDKLLRSSPMNPETLVRQRLAYKFGITQEKGFQSGHGAQQPLGVFMASAQGVPTSRDVRFASATAFDADALITAKYTLKGQYWNRARWLFHRDAMANIAKLKDTTNNYLWRENIRVGEPDLLLGRPVMMSEYTPNTFTASLYAGMLADWSWYYIIDSLNLTFRRLVELYAGTNQVGFIGRLETDGAPVLAEAFVRMQMAA